MSAKGRGRGHSRKHTHHTVKHHKEHGKHHQVHHHKAATEHHHQAHVHVKGHHAHHAKARGVAVGELLPVCSLEAVAMWLRLQGQRVTADDVAMRWAELGELSIPEAAEAFGLTASLRLPRPGTGETAGGIEPPGVREGACGATWQRLPTRTARLRTLAHLPVILGVDIPGPHAVLATPDGWWSWGDLCDPWPCRIEEAWAVTWS